MIEVYGEIGKDEVSRDPGGIRLLVNSPLKTRELPGQRHWGVSRNNEVKQLARNSLKVIREQLLMSKAELARKAGVSPLTIDRIENGKSCRMETMRKIILALGYTLEDKYKIFTANS